MAFYDENSGKGQPPEEDKATQDRRDLGLEMAGVDAGRQQRFLPKSASETPLERQKKSEREATLSALQMLMLKDAEYAALRLRVQDRLASADNRLAEMHLQAEAMLAESADRLEAIEARAGEMPDGTKVFRSADGQVFTKGGHALDAEQRADVRWKSGAPSWEEYREAKEAHAAIGRYRDKIEAIQAQVDAHQETLANDSDDPTSSSQLENIDGTVADQLNELESDLMHVRRYVDEDPGSDAALSGEFNAASPNVAAMPPPAGLEGGLPHLNR